MSYDRARFYRRLLEKLDAPRNEKNLAALTAWGECEGSDAAFNPLDTTQHADGATPYNTFGDPPNEMHVWNYPNEDTGLRATVETLRNGHYPHILAALKEGNGRVCFGEARAEMHTWGTNADCIAGKLKGGPVTEHAQEDSHAHQHDEAHHQNPPRPLTQHQREMIGRLTREFETSDYPPVDEDKDAVQRLLKAGRKWTGAR